MSDQPDSTNTIANIKHERVGDIFEATVTVKLQLRAGGHLPSPINDAFEAIVTTVKLQWNGKKGPQSDDDVFEAVTTVKPQQRREKNSEDEDVYEETTTVKAQRKGEGGSQCDDAFEEITRIKSQRRGESGPICDDESEDTKIVYPQQKSQIPSSDEDESEDLVKPRQKGESGPSFEDEFEDRTKAKRKQKGENGPSSEEDEFGDTTALKPQRKGESGPQSDEESEGVTAKLQRKGASGPLSDEESEGVTTKLQRKGESGPISDEESEGVTDKLQRKGDSGPLSDDEFGDMTVKPHRKGESGPLSDDEFGDKIVKPHWNGESGPLYDDDAFEEIREAAESENVWEHFLPSIYHDAVGNDPSLKFSTKKELFSFLCENPIFIDNGKKSFFLDKSSGSKCYILGARDLRITWGDDKCYWEWISLPESRFSEVARLKHVWWFEIRGTIRTCLLSSSTNYSAYLIFKMIGDTVLGLDIDPARVSIGVLGGSNQITHVCLDPYCGLHNFERWRTQVSPDMMGLKRPKKRNDGWYEAKLGEFFNEGSDDRINNDELEISCCETRGRVSKSDIIIEGIEIRPAKLDVENNDVIRKPPA